MIIRGLRWTVVCLALGIVTVIAWFVITSSQPPATSFVIPAGEVYTIAFHPHQNILATATDQGLMFWEPVAQPPPGVAHQVAGTISQHEPITQAVWSRDAQFLVTLRTMQQDLVIWDTAKPNQPIILPSPLHDFYNTVVTFSPDGSLLAAGTAGKQVYVWRWRDQRLLHTFHGSSYNGIAFSADGEFLAFAGTLWRINQKSGVLTEELDLDTVIPGTIGIARHLAMHPTLPILAVADTNGAITLLDVDTRQIIRSFLTPHVSITSLTFSPDGRFLASGGGYSEGADHVDPNIRLWRVADGQLVQTLTSSDLVGIETITISADNRWLAAITREGESLFRTSHSQARVWPIS